MSGTVDRRYRGACLRTKLLRGSSVVALVTAIGLAPAAGQSMSQLRAAVSANNAVNNQLLKNPNINQAAAEAAGMSAAAARALHYQEQVAQALALAQQAQIAARQAVLGSPGDVPDGLVVGGLQEVPDPLPAAKDPTGLSTWQGADQPTEKRIGKTVDVNIQQTQQRAILSWETFNVGQNTILNFDQSYKGQAEPAWVVLNRVVGTSTSPAEILGQIKAQGTVLIIDTNGILFGGASQINVNSLIASALEIGHPVDPITQALLTAKDRNDLFLEYGLLGYADQASQAEQSEEFTFSPVAYPQGQNGCTYTYCFYNKQGAVQVEAGASITANKGGFILLTGPAIVNAGALTAPQGQVSLEAGEFVTLTRSTGAANSATPDIRGFALSSEDNSQWASGTYVENTSTGIISAPTGYVSLMSNDEGGVINDGILEATTSVSRNGFVQLYAGDIQLGEGSTIAIGPDTTGEVIPSDPLSLTDFKPSKVEIGGNTSRVEMQRDAMIYAPGGNVTIGVDPGSTTQNGDGLSRVFIDTGAVIDVAGLPDVFVPASINSITIHPVTGNDLQDDPNAYKYGFLNGATVYVDPRVSGVRSDGVAWVGSPLIPAGSYYQQVGISVQQLMTKGGNVSLGADAFAQGGNQNLAGDVTIKSGAVIDLDGGWVTYQAGWVQTSMLIDASGNVVNIADANPDDVYLGIYDGFTAVQSRWGVVQNFADPLFLGRQYDNQYTEGRDAGSLTLKSSVIVLDGTVYAHAFPGPQQLADAQQGTLKSSVYGDGRMLQGAPSQLPNGGFLFVQALANDSQNSSVVDGGGDIDIVDQADYHALPSDFSYGQSISIQNGQLVIPTRDPNSYLPTDRIDTIMLNADALSQMGLSDLALATSGEINVEKGAEVDLSAGGSFQAVSGRTMTIDGKISVPSGNINLQTVSLYGSGDTINGGSVFVPEQAQLGSYDIIVNGTLSTRGLWTNDYGALPYQMLGQAYTNGGNVTLDAAPSVLLYAENSGQQVNEDISGSILVNKGALIDVSSGGYVSPTGVIDLSERGGNVSLIDQTNFFQTSNNQSQFEQSAISGFRVDNVTCGNVSCLPSNPDQINARVYFAPGTIIGYGFGGGGTFTLDTPSIAFGDGMPSSGTELPLDFFSREGFANYDITTYKTDLVTNQFDNGQGGYNAVLATDVLTVGAGQTLDLTQSYLALDLNNPARLLAEMKALESLPTGGNIYSIIKPSIPTDAWDRKAVNLTLGGLIELDIAKGGTLVDEAGGTLTVSQLDNEGKIRIPGGIIDQTEVLPEYFATNGVGVQNIDDAFTVNANGTIDENATDEYAVEHNLTCGGQTCTNGAFAADYDIYLLGTLAPGVGVHLGAGSVTDLSGTSIRDPRAFVPGHSHFVTGDIISGGTLEAQSAYLFKTPLFLETIGLGIYGESLVNQNPPQGNDPVGQRLAEMIVADPGSTLNISGASDTYDELGQGDLYSPTQVWSNAGSLVLGNGGTITGATILARGGAPEALGGTLVMLDPVFYQNDPSTPTLNAISQQEISASGFATLVAEGKIDSVGNAVIKLSRGFFLTSRPYDGQTSPDLNNDYYAIIVSSGGNLEIDAPYIGFDSIVQSVSTPDYGTPGANRVTFKADNIDVMGGVLFDTSIANATLYATGDVRLIGVQPADVTLGLLGGSNTSSTLQGQLSVNGNLTIDAAQVYPTTGSTFYVTSAASDGTIRFGRTTRTAPPTPYSAGADLTIQAANIVLGGVIRVPVGSLTIGSDTPLEINGTVFAPGTNSVEATAGSITSVSAAGLFIPYGTTTDQTEWYFSPTSSAQLTAPPQAILTFGGNSVSLDSGATVDLSGGGNLYAYEFIPGLGGSRDVLDRYNPDEFSGNAGYQYPGGAQVYAIVPGLSSNAVAPYDPIYSANYGDLYSSSNAGESIYLTGAAGLAAGWYTLLPAQYATLPGGMRVVQQMNAPSIAPGTSYRLDDGTMVISGYYGIAGTGTRSATPVTFEVQGQSTFLQYSQIALTYANEYFAQLAAKNGNAAPRLPVDAGRLILAPADSLVVNTALITTPGPGGRGSEVDITGSSFDIVSNLDQGKSDAGAIILTADSLTNLDASSLLIGGVRTDNADGTTSINVTAQSITVANDSSHPLEGPEIVLAVDGEGAGITLDNGATIVATGTAGSAATGNYVIDGGGNTGAALLRVAVGPQRLASLENTDQSGLLALGDVTLKGNSVLLDSSGNMTVANSAIIEANALALGAGQVTFTNNGHGLSGLVITPELQALFSKANLLTILTPDAIAFAAGSYDFGNIIFDSPGLSLLNGNGVTINANTLTFMNGNPAGLECGQSAAPVCGHGDLSVNATQIDFGWGTVNTYGFGGSVTLAASQGMFMTGKGSVDFGPAALHLETPYIGDLGYVPAPGVSEWIPSVTLVTTGIVDITNPTHRKAPKVIGAPGASLTIDGHSISVDGTELRATAGTLALDSKTGIDITGGAILETPSYAKTFGDSADPVSVSAPGGTLKLVAENGGITAAAGTTLSVGGNVGSAGTLSLSASNGVFDMAGAIIASTPSGGGSLNLDSGGYFDLASFVDSWGRDFSGTIDIRSAHGNLDLLPGETLKAADVSLTADGGIVDIAGTIDVSGTNGGNIDLYGIGGVTLENTALLDAHADGYGKFDPRQASGGIVNIGTDDKGVIDVKTGAVIDVRALRTRARLIPITLNGGTYYYFVPADVGGQVNFRLPVIQGQNGEIVNMYYAGNIEGASSIVLEGFDRWNLAQIADDPNFVGVTINAQGQAVLDVSAQAGSGQLNFLADNGTGTIVNFIQNFNISASYGNLGNLTSMANFHARPGVELDYSGDIVLSSNWNLGAGTVNIAAAVAAGLMLPVDPGCTSKCQYYVIPGDEGEVFAKYTTLTYRVGGKVLGEPGILTLRAGGNLEIDGSVTDGFFQFGDQTDANYLQVALGAGNRYYIPYLIPGCAGLDATCANLVDWQYGLNLGSIDYINLGIPKSFTTQSFLFNPVPYNPNANTPWAEGNDGALSSMQPFPLVRIDNRTYYVPSWSYQLVAGADLTGGEGNPSANPLQTVPGSEGSVIVQGIASYTYGNGNNTSTSNWANQIDFQVGSQFLTADSWYMAFLSTTPQADQNSYTYIDFSKAPSLVQQLIDDSTQFQDFLNQYSGQYQLFGTTGSPDAISMSLFDAAQFMLDVVEPNAAGILSNYTPPTSKPLVAATTATYETLIRTGTGSIDIAAAQDINLENGSSPTYEQVVGLSGDNLQLGGSPVYTIGHIAIVEPETVVDELTGDTFVIDPTGYDDTTDVFSQPLTNGYQYGIGPKNSNPDTPGVGYAGIMIANPVYLTGGGNISLTAGRDVISRRDVWGEATLMTYYDGSSGFGYSWIGTSDQPWRVGTVGDITNILINPQLFTEGVGALGGGNIAITAGRDIVDLTVADDTSVTTASVTSSSAQPSLGIWQFGGGNVVIDAGADILGGRIDVGEGYADISAGGNIESAGTIVIDILGNTPYTADNAMRLRLSDATMNVSAGGSIDIEGIAALGVQGASSDYAGNLDAQGFYTPIAGVSLIADQSVTIENSTGQDSNRRRFDRSIVTVNSTATDNRSSAVYPGSLEIAALTGAIDVVSTPSTADTADEVVLYPSPAGQLDLYAGADILPVTIDMEDGDPGLLPGIFSVFSVDSQGNIQKGRTFAFPGVLPNTAQVVLESYHNKSPTHLGDPYPVRIDAGGDILDMIVSVPKQARIWAGRDIINMMFFGQNLLPTDITRIVAGRDISATTTLVKPVVLSNGQEEFGAPEPALEGNTFIIGGPGSFFLEAGRDAGPFLNSAVTSGIENAAGGVQSTGSLTFAGGIVSVGNMWNPWLPPVGANLYVEFGVGKGEDFNAVRDYYLDPANQVSWPAYLFQQQTNASGNQTPNRNAPIYGPILVHWMQKNAPALLEASYGTLKVTFQQAYDAFKMLPELQQQIFLLDDVYFNELVQTSIPTGPSYENYSRGYIAINLLFPSSLGYTQNNLGGGTNGANKLVQTGNLDLRLSAIESMWGGNVYILGPGGRALIGSTVATAAQAALRTYAGGQLFDGVPILPGGDLVNQTTLLVPYPSSIDSIPSGYEGVITLRGGSIDTFTDDSFLLNQSRLFTEDGGDIAMWSSNGNLDAGEGPKTSSDFPPVVVQVDEDLVSEVNSAGGVTGAGIAAFEPAPGVAAPDVFLIAPRGTVDAGAAGVRVAGNLFVAAFSVGSASNFSVGGSTVGIPGSAAVNVAAQTGASSSAAAAAQAAQMASGASNGNGTDESIITVEVLGPADTSGDEELRKRRQQKL